MHRRTMSLHTLLRTAATACALALLTAPAAAALLLQRLPVAFDRPIALDTHQPSGRLLATAFYPTGDPVTLRLLQTAAQGGNRNHSSLSGLTEEVDLVTVQAGHTIGDPVGTTYVAGTDGRGNRVIERVSADGSLVTRVATLPGRQTMRLALDGTGLWGGRLIATSRSGELYAIDAAGQIETLDTGAGDLQGLTVLPNDAARYGRFAGCIMSGTEGSGAGTTHFWCRTASGGVEHLTRALGGLRIDEIAVIDGGNLYVVDFGSGQILGAEADAFAGMTGELLVLQEFAPGSAQSTLYRLGLDAGGSDWVVQALDFSVDGGGRHLEEIVFSRVGLGPIDAVADPVAVPLPPTLALLLAALPALGRRLPAARGRA